jgi:hypothetical protein
MMMVMMMMVMMMMKRGSGKSPEHWVAIDEVVLRRCDLCVVVVVAEHHVRALRPLAAIGILHVLFLDNLVMDSMRLEV